MADRYAIRQQPGATIWDVLDTAPAVSEAEYICSTDTEQAALVVWRALTVYDMLLQDEPDVASNILDATDDAKARAADEADMQQIAREWDAFDRE